MRNKEGKCHWCGLGDDNEECAKAGRNAHCVHWYDPSRGVICTDLPSNEPLPAPWVFKCAACRANIEPHPYETNPNFKAGLDLFCWPCVAKSIKGK